ncbi:protein-tyrosine kinase 6b [Denticeps clupeoides]|uniref:Tyrosine-protein kinase n=1 Tax=Denticeps clupeoides TaxID=299321 RepID=A0AAY4D2E5_9TELE|nr:protein-tyrosine kinase 6 [Denticeps clupeoides]
MGESERKTCCGCCSSLWPRIFGGADECKKAEGERTDGSDDCVARYAPHALPAVGGTEAGIYRALWPFEARVEDELSFQAGDLFKVTSRTGEWWTALKIDHAGRTLATGIVPCNYLAGGEPVDSQPWFFGKMNRIEALSHLLSPENGDGAFLVRLSETSKVGHVLSVKVENRAKHFQINQLDEQFCVERNKCFPSLLELVKYYQTHRLASVERLGESCIRVKPQPKDLSHSTVDEWELPKDEFTLEEQLGSGYFADVYRGMWRNRIKVAIKILKNFESLNQQAFQKEVHILKKLRHRHLISLFAICTSSMPYFIITEFMMKGNLLDFLRGEEGSKLDRMSLIDMASQVADGMSYLESTNSIHRDLAARNILVGENYLCKVADFGLARIIKEPFYVSEDKKIPYKWSAPEAISHGCFSNKSDVWSFGILLYEIFTYGGIPYPGFSTSEVYGQVIKGYRMPAPPHCPPYIYDVMMSCWRIKPADRPEFSDLKPDLENINRYELE